MNDNWTQVYGTSASIKVNTHI